MSTDAITIKNFSKSFGNTEVIHDLNFEVKHGEIFAFLGANGSGKTTTIRCLLHTYQADRGTLLVDGKDYDVESAGTLGYLPEERGLYTTSRVLETMIYFGQIKGLTYTEAHDRAVAYLDRVELGDKHKTEIKSLSSGQQQKLQLGITIINNPKLLILDEPTKGLDPVNRSLLLDILLDMNKKGTTILFSTHQMEEAERIADRLVMIKHGHRALYGGIQEVKDSFGNKLINVTFGGKLPEHNDLFTAVISNHNAELTPKQGVETAEILKFLAEDTQLKLTKFELNTPTLNDIFIQVTNTVDA